MPFKIAIVNNSTKELRLIHEDGDWYDTYDYMWLEGNYSCDCNRALFWSRAAGEDDLEMECGESAFICPYVELADGTKIELE